METYTKWIIAIIILIIVIGLIWWGVKKYKEDKDAENASSGNPASSPIASPATSTNPFQLNKVLYGRLSGDASTYMDYTSQAQANFDPSTGVIQGPIFKTLGDPAPGYTKAMIVSYTYNRAPLTFVYSEDLNSYSATSVQLPTSTTPFQLEQVLYGISTKQTDYTQKALQYFDASKGTLQGPIYKTLGDPNPGQSKVLTVYYTYNGTPLTFTWDESVQDYNTATIQLPISQT